MYCHNCGAPVKDGAKFCASCGVRQESAAPSVITEIRCPFCGEKLEPDSVFCENCGKKISRAGTKTPAEKHPSHKTKKSKVQTVVIPIVLSVLLISVTGYVIWAQSKEEPKRSGDKDRETRVTETEERRSTKSTTATDTTESKNRRESETTEETTVFESNETLQPSSTEQTADHALKHDPVEFQTSDTSKMGDFQWITYDIMYGNIPEDVELLTDPQEVAGGWKAYIIDDYSGENSVYIDRLCNCFISVNGKNADVTIKWDYLFNGSTNESYSEKDTPDSYYKGSWSNGTLAAAGSGSIYLSGFWYKDGKEYALGTMTWVDGLTSTVFLVRP